MGDLRRRRDARDIWISRKHLTAGALLMVLTSVTSFLLGFWVGRDEVVHAPVASVPISVPDDALVDLLARVEASGLADGGLEALTFPDALRGAPGDGPAVPQRPSELSREHTLNPLSARGQRPDIEQIDPPPAGQFTVSVATLPTASEARALERRLAEMGIRAWIAPQLVEGSTHYRLAVGAYVDRDEAMKVLPIVGAAGFTGTVVAL